MNKLELKEKAVPVHHTGTNTTKRWNASQRPSREIERRRSYVMPAQWDGNGGRS